MAKRSWYERCVAKIKKTLGVSVYRADDICNYVQKKRDARKHAFWRTIVEGMNHGDSRVPPQALLY